MTTVRGMDNSKKKIRRGFVRRSPDRRVNVTCQKNGTPGAGPKVNRHALDLSEAGARLLVSTPLQVGEKVVLGLQVPPCQALLKRLGTVVWSFPVNQRDYAVGIHLDELLCSEDIHDVTIPHRR